MCESPSLYDIKTMRLLILCSYFTLFFVGLTLGVMSLGALQPMNPVVAGFGVDCEDTTRLCWYGVVLGVTSMDEADTMLRGKGFHSEKREDYLAIYLGNCTLQFYSTYEYTEAIDSVLLSTCALRLGNLPERFGQPEWVAPDNCGFEIRIGYQRKVTVLVWPTEKWLWVSPYLEVQFIHFTIGQPSPDYRYRWRGFLPYNRYNDFEPREFICPGGPG
jgi:hypothetical protein